MKGAWRLLTALAAVTLLAVAVYATALSIEELKRLGAPLVYPLPIPGAEYAVLDGERGVLLVIARGEAVYTLSLTTFKVIDRVEFRFPLLGTIAAAYYDEVGGILATATDKGELILFKLESGKAKPLLFHAHPAKPKKIVASGDHILVLWDDNVLELASPGEAGWFTVASITGNLTWDSVQGIIIHDIAVLEEEPQKPTNTVALLYSVYGGAASLVLRLVYSENETVIPMSFAEVIAYTREYGVVYQAATDENGLVSLRLPVPTENITLYIAWNGTLYAKTLNITINESMHIVLEEPIVVTPGDRTVTPVRITSFNIMVARIEDERLKPIRTLFIKALEPPRLLGFYTLDENHTILVLEGIIGDIPSKSLVIFVLDSSYNITASYWEPVTSTATATYFVPDKKMLIIGFDDGIVEAIVYDESQSRFYTGWRYLMTGSVEVLKATPSLGKLYGVAGVLALDSNGVFQLLAINRTVHVPTLRVNTTLGFTASTPVLDATRDANIIVVGGGGQQLYLVIGLGDAVASQPLIDPLDLKNYLVAELRVKVTDPEGTPISGALVTVYDNQGTPIKNATTGSDGVAYIGYLLPGTYNVTVRPPKGIDWLSAASTTVRLEPGLSLNAIVVLSYRPVPITITILDEYGGPPLDPIEVVVNGSSYLLDKPPYQLTVMLVKGTYVVEARPVSADPLYQAKAVNITVPEQRNVTIVLDRVGRRITISLLEPDGTRVREPLRIIIMQDNITFVNRTVSPAELPVSFTLYTRGRATVYVEPVSPAGEASRYKATSKTILVIDGLFDVIYVPLNLIPVELVFTDKATGGSPVTSLEVIIDDKQSYTVEAGARSIVLNLTKGVHRVRIVSKPSETIPVPLYRDLNLTLNIATKTKVPIVLERAYAEVTLRVVDELAGTAPADNLEVIVNDELIEELPAGTSNTTIYVPKDRVTLVLRSKTGLYYEYRETFTATNDTIDKTIRLRRTIYTVNVRVVDALGRALTGILVTAVGQTIPYTASGITLEGEAQLQLPYGIYLICTRHDWYQQRCSVVDPAATREVTFTLNYTPIGLIMANIHIIISVTLVAIVAVLLIRLRHRIVRALAPEEEVF